MSSLRRDSQIQTVEITGHSVAVSLKQRQLLCIVLIFAWTADAGSSYIAFSIFVSLSCVLQRCPLFQELLLPFRNEHCI